MSDKPPDKVTLIVLKRTHQVVAVATRQAVPETALAVSEKPGELAVNAAEELKVLVGSSLVVRDLIGPTSGSPLGVPDLISSGVTFPASELDVITVDLNPNVFKIKNARSFVIGDDKKLTPGVDPTSSSTSVALHAIANRITVTLSEPPAQDTPVTVWIYRDDGTKPPEAVEGEIKKPDATLTSPPTFASVDLDVSLSTGAAYHFLALVQGYKPAVYEQQI